MSNISNVHPAITAVKRHRTARGMSLNELTRLSGLSWKTVRDADQGRRRTNHGSYVAMAAALGVPVEALS